MSDLVTWLRAQLDDDESAAQAAANYSAKRGYSFPTDGSGTYNMLAYEHEQHATRHNPARVLAEVDAKRRILDRHASYDFPADPEDGPGDYSWTGRCDHCHEVWPCPDLRDLALPYADRPGYREEWRP